MSIQFIYFGKRGGGVNDLISLLNSITISNYKIYSLNNIVIKNKTTEFNNKIIFDYLQLPSNTQSFFKYILTFQWLKIFKILNKNKPEHIIISMFHPFNFFIFFYKFLFLKNFKIYTFLHNDNKIQTFNKLVDIIIRFHDILFCLLSNKIFLLSNNVYQYAANHYLLKYKKMEVIGFGVYYNRDSMIHPIEFYSNNPITLIFFGKILPYKGLDILIESLEILNHEGYNYKCYIIGEGNINFTTRSNNITIINEWVEDAKLQYFINISHFSIFPYISCSQSGALSTAISNNIPVLVSNIPEFKKYIIQNKFGYILEDLNPKSIADFIKKIDYERNDLFMIHKNIINFNQNNKSWFEVWNKIHKSLILT